MQLAMPYQQVHDFPLCMAEDVYARSPDSDTRCTIPKRRFLTVLRMSGKTWHISYPSI